eukprot:jgi/Chrzof1/14288/Cz08g31400.t1
MAAIPPGGIGSHSLSPHAAHVPGEIARGHSSGLQHAQTPALKVMSSMNQRRDSGALADTNAGSSALMATATHGRSNDRRSASSSSSSSSSHLAPEVVTMSDTWEGSRLNGRSYGHLTAREGDGNRRSILDSSQQHVASNVVPGGVVVLHMKRHT